MTRNLSKKQFRKARAKALVSFVAGSYLDNPINLDELSRNLCEYYRWSPDQVNDSIEYLIDEGKACVVAEGEELFAVIPEAAQSDKAYWADFVQKERGEDADIN